MPDAVPQWKKELDAMPQSQLEAELNALVTQPDTSQPDTAAMPTSIVSNLLIAFIGILIFIFIITAIKNSILEKPPKPLEKPPKPHQDHQPPPQPTNSKGFMMTWLRNTIITLMFTFLAYLMIDWLFLNKYDKCILEHVQGTSSKEAVNMIATSCRNLYK